MDLCHNCLHKTAQYVLEKASTDGLAPVTISVYDRNGLPAYFMRMQGCVKLAIPIATEKAKTSALMGVSTRQIHTRLLDENLSLADFCGAATTSLVGGVALSYAGSILGGVGISGRKPVDDEKLALLFSEEFAKQMQAS